MAKIDKDGIYDVSAEAYHGDLCVGPSLSGSGAHTLLDLCPAKYFETSYLNPDYTREITSALEFGTALHTMLLEPGKWKERIREVEHTSYRKHYAAKARDLTRIQGLVPLLTHEIEEIRAMCDSVMKKDAARRLLEGAVETTFVWKDEETGIWSKVRPDVASSPNPKTIVDVKTVASAHPDAFSRAVYNFGYYLKAGFQFEAVKRLFGYYPDRFIFLVIEKDPPYQVELYELDERDIQIGIIRAATARRIFRECLDSGFWRGYTDEPAPLTMPGFAHINLEEAISLDKEKHPRPARIEPNALGAG